MATSKGMIATRQRISEAQAGMVAQHTADSLMSLWGLNNARKIAKHIKKTLDAEAKRRKEEK